MTLYSIIFSLFILMDSVGNVPIFLSLLKEIPPKRQVLIIFRELMISLFVMILFYFIGDLLLDALNVTQETVKIAGGIILFLIALKMIFPASEDVDPSHHRAPKEPFIVPLAIPLIAGPGALATIMLYAQQSLTTFTVVSGIVIAWILSAIILLSSAWLQKLLGERVLTALERLMGLILTLMAVQMLVEGIKTCAVRD